MRRKLIYYYPVRSQLGLLGLTPTPSVPLLSFYSAHPPFGAIGSLGLAIALSLKYLPDYDLLPSRFSAFGAHGRHHEQGVPNIGA